MTRRLVVPAVLSLMALEAFLFLPAAALAHGGNPNFRSVFDRMATPLPGVQVQVIGYDAFYELRSTAKQPVTVYGYEGEPYSRILPDGTVQQNVNSPAVYLNEDFYGTSPVPAHARRGAPVVWRTVDKTGTVIWHDHRMHWLAKSRPPQVKSEHQKTKIFDYRIPVSEGATRSAIEGTLFWVGPAGGGFPTAAAVALVVFVAGSIALVVVVRRRRAALGPASPDGAGGPEGPAGASRGTGGGSRANDEPVAGAPRPEREAW